MRILLLIVASAGIFLSHVACDEVAIKRDTFPYMAYVYYPDQTIDGAEGKFIRNAVLIKLNWLLSASLENENNLLAFPEKTLIARVGSVIIDVKFNLNEDEGEQEREVIRIARPYDFNKTEWWYYDISLLKTLLPFNITSAVAPIPSKSNEFSSGQNCFMLIYAKHNQKLTEERMLLKISVELMRSSLNKCGNYFSNDTMVCATTSDVNNLISSDPNFCLVNSGGPLICSNELIGIQTYINHCNEPYLYQSLRPWDDLISCAIEEKCQEEQCAKICSTVNKDPATVTTPIISVTEDVKLNLTDNYVNETSTKVTIAPTLTSVDETREISTAKLTSTSTEEDQYTTKITILSTVSHITTIADIPPETSQNTQKDSTELPEESERRTNLEAKHHAPRSDACVITGYLFKYFIYCYIAVVAMF